MTNREFFETVITLANDNDDVIAFAKESIAKLDKKNESAKSKKVELAKANEPLLKAIREYVATHETSLASEIASANNISTSKASAMLKKLVDSEEVVKTEVPIPKVGKRMVYRLKR